MRGTTPLDSKALTRAVGMINEAMELLLDLDETPLTADETKLLGAAGDPEKFRLTGRR